MARPRKKIDPAQVESLAAIGCTVAEIAAVMDCSRRTLETRFCAYIEKGRECMKMSLRRSQMRVAEKGNATMLIWLGKQYLGQKDTVTNYNLDFSKLTDEQLRRIASGEDPAHVAASPGSGGTVAERGVPAEFVN